MQEDPSKQDHRFWLLVSCKLSGEATVDELAELDELLRKNPDWRLRMEILQNFWKGEPEEEQDDAAVYARHLQRLTSDGSVSPRRFYVRRLLWPIAGAAAAMIIVWSIYQAYPTKHSIQGVANTISTRSGSKSKIQLPDGTQVWLNADSRLSYDKHFQATLREVQLTGEAYFDVVKDKDHPFIIHTPVIDVNVLGTSLNVRSYANEKNTETVLIRGSIEVLLHNSPDKKIVLQPNEKLVVRNGEIAPMEKAGQRQEDDTPVMTLKTVHFREADSTATEILWTRNKLAFDHESLEAVVQKIERWYAVRVIITNEGLKRTTYSGVFEDESLRQVMEALRLSGNFRYTINKKEVTITP